MEVREAGSGPEAAAPTSLSPADVKDGADSGESASSSTPFPQVTLPGFRALRFATCAPAPPGGYYFEPASVTPLVQGGMRLVYRPAAVSSAHCIFQPAVAAPTKTPESEQKDGADSALP